MNCLKNRVRPWLYRWLPRICGCHCRADRSFFYKGWQFPVCARCTGEVLGLCLSFLVFFWYQIPLWLAGALLVPMLLDGGIQLTTRYESTNPRRLVTGFAFGFGLYVLFGHSILFAFWQGYHFLQ